MDGLCIKIVTTDDLEKVYSLRPRIIVDFEQKYNKGLAKLIGDEQNYLRELAMELIALCEKEERKNFFINNFQLSL